MKKTTFFLFFLAITAITHSFAQISFGGTPPSFSFEVKSEILESAENVPFPFDMTALRAEDAERKLDNLPPRVGKTIPVNFTTTNSGEWTLLPNGQDIWRLCIIAEDAIGIMLLYDKFEIPTGGKLFVYNSDRSQVLGAYTEETNPKKTEFSTEFVEGDIITLEYLAPPTTDYETPIIITGVVYGYNYLHFEKSPKGTSIAFGSDPCQVNINCPEGNNWQDQKKGVARIITFAGNNSYYCSGSLVNNTAGDLDPLFLSAHHCFEGSNTADVNRTTFHFHYEYLNCTGNTTETQRTTTGATMLVDVPLNGASDGTLLRLNNDIPPFWDVYYNGWDRRNIAPTSGVCIHHPSGDRKKISTFTQTLTSGYCLPGMPYGASWTVRWAATQTNHGVTEGGSSGSPLFNQDKRIVGTLTGGSSQCSNTYLTDCYGKVYSHWDQHATQKMKTYLDPVNSGAEFVDGMYTTVEYCKSAKKLTVTYTEECKAVLAWEASAMSPVTYNVFRDDEKIASNITATTYTDTELNPKERHTWKVITVCTCGDSEPVSVTGTQCLYTVSLSAKPVNGGTVSGDGDYKQNSNATIEATPNENYRFVKWTRNNAEVSTASPYTFEVTGNITLVANFELYSGINENGEKFFTFYPNPAGNQLNIVRPDAGKAQIVIYNNIGVAVLSNEIADVETQINISTLSSGIYFIRLTDGQNSATQSFVKE
jgi:hypothetical protein